MCNSILYMCNILKCNILFLVLCAIILQVQYQRNLFYGYLHIGCCNEL